MNKFIEIQDGISINVNSIDAIEDSENNTCKVYVGTRIYQATYPYSTFMSLIKSEIVVDKATPREEQFDKTMKKLDGVLKNTGYFAG